MSTSLILACIWVLAGASVSLLPIRWQYAPGIVLLALAPTLTIYLAMQHDPWIVLVSAAVVISMFRRPLMVLIRHLRKSRRGGQQP